MQYCYCCCCCFADAQCVVDIFVNYDCDLAAANIFERLTNDLARIAQGQHSMILGATPAQGKRMRIEGLKCLVSILKCMVEWSKDIYVNPHSQSNLSNENITLEASGCSYYFHVFTLPGQDTRTVEDTTPDSGRGSSLLSSSRFESSNSLSSSNSTLNAAGGAGHDDPEQFEVLKQQKDLWETGIELYARLYTKHLNLHAPGQ